MTQEEIDVKTDAGIMPVHITAPDGSGPFTLIVLYMDAPGIRGDLYTAASRLAEEGYLVALPDLYYRLDRDRRPDPEQLRAGDEGEFKRMAAAVATVQDPVVMADTRAMIDTIRERLSIDEGGWGCVGFCLGGRVGLRAAAEFGDAMRAGSLLHPAGIVTDAPDSPHRDLSGVRAELYFAFGENDHVSPPSTIPPIRDSLERDGVIYRIEVFPNAEHGFMMPTHRAYNRDVAEQGWRGTLELLRRALPVAH